MGFEDIGKVVDLWMNNPEFRKKFRQNPDDCVRSSGLTLSADEWTSLKKIDWTLSDEDLKTRINKIP